MHHLKFGDYFSDACFFWSDEMFFYSRSDAHEPRNEGIQRWPGHDEWWWHSRSGLGGAWCPNMSHEKKRLGPVLVGFFGDLQQLIEIISSWFNFWKRRMAGRTIIHFFWFCCRCVTFSRYWGFLAMFVYQSVIDVFLQWLRPATLFFSWEHPRWESLY